MKIKNRFLAAALCLSAITGSVFAETFTETLHPHWGQSYVISKVILDEESPLQHLMIFENEQFGKVLVLDGAVQTTEKDEFFYHEMLAHVPLLAHGNAQNILIIGGGDGGILREVVRHKSVKTVTMVEIDDRVINLCKEYFPNHSNGAFNSPKTRVVIQDAYEFVGNTREKFDVIICDTTDPIGPGAILFTPEFYARCNNALNIGGILVTQSGVPFMQMDEMIHAHQNLSKVFPDATFYRVAVPTYVGGDMILGWSAKNKNLRNIDSNIIEQRMRKDIDGEMRYYTPKIHVASFVLPKYIEEALANPDKYLKAAATSSEAVTPTPTPAVEETKPDEVIILPIEENS